MPFHHFYGTYFDPCLQLIFEDGVFLAIAIASSRSLARMRKYPAITSFDSLNGPSFQAPLYSQLFSFQFQRLGAF